MKEQISSNSIPEWSFLKKALVIFLVSYLLLYIFPFPLEIIPYATEVLQYYYQGLNYVFFFVADNILNIVLIDRFTPNGSGDTTNDYVRVFALILISVIVSISVNIIFRKKSNYEKLFYRVLVYTSIYVGCMGISYGLAKIFEGQFRFPSPQTFDKPFGDFSPMGLLWNFMGFSRPYTMFGGIMEFLGGFLLFFKRTRTIGAVIIAAVMLNIVMLNFCYDVPVKLFSSHLLLFSLLVILPDIKRLYEFFILRKQTSLKDLYYGFRSKTLNITSVVLKYIIVATFIVLNLFQQIEWMESSKKYTGSNLTTDNMYRAQSFSINGNTISQLNTNYKIDLDTINKTAKFLLGTKMYSTHYYFEDSSLHVNGISESDSISVIFRKKDMNEYLLISRGFHWINESPYNR